MPTGIYVRTEAQKKNISAGMKGKNTLGHAQSIETKAKISATTTGKPKSDETRVHMSVAQKGHVVSSVARANMSAGQLGRTASLETRMRMSASHKGSITNLGRIASPETRAKMSASAKGKLKSATARANMSKAQMGKTMSPASIAKMAATKWRGGPAVSTPKRSAKRRTLGFVPLNQPFEGCNGHHVDRERVVYIPEVLHMSIRHNVWNGRNMDKINAVAFDYLSKQEVAQ